MTPYTGKAKFEFNKDNLKKSHKIIAQYPKTKQASAIVPLLDLAQRQNSGWISNEIIGYIANILDMEPIKIYEIASFYSAFNLKPVGKYHIRVCSGISCWLRGGSDIMERCKKVLKINNGETTEDSNFTLEKVECLGSCVNAPVMKINDDYYEDLTPDSVEKILSDLSEYKKPKKGSQIGRKSSEAKKCNG
jgi:NADH-quinone oxidoreductase E subunit